MYVLCLLPLVDSTSSDESSDSSPNTSPTQELLLPFRASDTMSTYSRPLDVNHEKYRKDSGSDSASNDGLPCATWPRESTLLPRMKVASLERIIASFQDDFDEMYFADSDELDDEEELYFVHPLIDKTVQEGSDFALTVELSKSNVQVKWCLDGIEIIPENCSKYSFVSEAPTHVLLVHDVDVDDEGEYSCQAGRKYIEAYVTVIDMQGNYGLLYTYHMNSTTRQSLLVHHVIYLVSMSCHY